MIGWRQLVTSWPILLVALGSTAGYAATGPIADATSTYDEDLVTVHTAVQQALRSSGFLIERSSAVDEESYRVVGLLDDAQTARSPTGGTAMLRMRVRIESKKENGQTVVNAQADEDANYGGGGDITEHRNRFFDNLDRALGENSSEESDD